MLQVKGYYKLPSTFCQAAGALDTLPVIVYYYISKILNRRYFMKQEQLPQISEAEYEIMKIIWAHHPISTNDVCEQVSKTHHWSPKTVHTLLSRLYSKQAVSYEKKNRMYYYSPLIRREDYLPQENRSFLNRFYDGRVDTMFSAFLNEKDVSRQELQELYQMLEEKLKPGD